MHPYGAIAQEAKAVGKADRYADVSTDVWKVLSEYNVR